MTRAISAAIVSSKKQAEEGKASIPSQLEANAALALKNGWDIVQEIVVRGHSRYVTNVYKLAEQMEKKGIPDYSILLRMIEERSFDVLIVRELSRLGREQAIIAQIITDVIRSGAIIHSHLDGIINKNNFREYIAIGGYTASKEIDYRVERTRLGIENRVKRGIPRRTIGSHKFIRDDDGKVIGVQVREERRQLWNDLFTLIMEGVGWDSLSVQMARRFGHYKNPATKQMYPLLHFYELLHHPTFWGHSADHIYLKRGLWVFTRKEVPLGVVVYWDMFDAVYTGEQAAAIIPELMRRPNLKGRSVPHTKHAMTGLVVCAECLYSRCIGRGVWRCNSRWLPPRTCTQRKGINDQTVRIYINSLLEVAILNDDLSVISPATTNGESTKQTARQVETEIKKQAATIDNLILDKADAPTDAKPSYTRLINEAVDRVNAMKEELKRLRSTEETPAVTQSRHLTFNRLKQQGLPAFWQQEPYAINQQLRILFGNFRIAIDKGKVAGLIEL